MPYENDAKYNWEVLRDLVSSDDTPLAAFSYSDWPASGTINVRELFPDARAVKIMFFGSDAADETFDYILYSRHKMNGPIETAIAGNVILGTKPCAKHPITGAALTNHFWGDTATVTSGLMDSVDTIQDSAVNDIAAITFPMQGIADLFLEIDKDTNAKAGAIIVGIYE